MISQMTNLIAQTGYDALERKPHSGVRTEANNKGKGL